jgi:hypothetical protein
MNWKLSKELRRRGLHATSVHELGLANQATKDGALYKALAEREPCVLIAWDNRMVSSHREALLHHGTTLSVIDKRAERGGRTPQEYYREVIHRHVHRMVIQPPGTWFRYTLSRRYSAQDRR